MSQLARNLWAIAILAAVCLASTLAFTFLNSMRGGEQAFFEPIRVPIILDKGALAHLPLTLRTRGEIDGQAVGFELQFLPEWATRKHEPDAGLPSIVATWGNLALLRSGPESDGLLRVLESRLTQSSSARRFREVVPAKAMSLSGGPEAIRAGPVIFKLFLGRAGTQDYAELFLQVDLARGFLEISEKDLAYREALLRELSE